MSRNSISTAFLKLACIASMTPQLAFSTGTLEAPSEPSKEPQKLVTAHALALSPEVLSFERLPSDIIRLILAELPKRDLLSLRAVGKKLKEMATQLITNVRISANLPNWKQVGRLFQDLTTVKFWEGREPSKELVTLFRQAPIRELYLSDRRISDEKITIIAPALPADLQILDLTNNNIGDVGLQALMPHLPAGLQGLYLGLNNIGDAGIQTLAPHLPKTLKWLYLKKNNIGDAGMQALVPYLPASLLGFDLEKNDIGDAGLSVLLEAIPRTDLENIIISVPSDSSFYELFRNLSNRYARPISVRFW